MTAGPGMAVGVGMTRRGAAASSSAAAGASAAACDSAYCRYRRTSSTTMIAASVRLQITSRESILAGAPFERLREDCPTKD